MKYKILDKIGKIKEFNHPQNNYIDKEKKYKRERREFKILIICNFISWIIFILFLFFYLNIYFF